MSLGAEQPRQWQQPIALIDVVFSFDSVLTFPSGTVVTRLSGDSGLHVSGNVVTNSAFPVDVNGTIQLTGAYTTISFTLAYPGTDGIFFQVGGTR